MRRLTYGSMTSHRSAMTTIAVAQRATVTARCLLRSARGPREEDHSIRGARNVLERPHHLGLAPARRALDRDRRPHPLLELAPELLDEHPLVLAGLDVALGDQLLAIPRAHAQELHRPHYVTRVTPVRRASVQPTPTPSTFTGPGPRPMPRCPSRTAPDAILRASRAAWTGLAPSASRAASAL